MFHSNYESIDFSFFFQPLREILEANPNGLKEYELIRELGNRGISEFSADRLSDDLGLFQIHFLLFHTLYRLNDHLKQSGEGSLTIHVLEIRWNREDFQAGPGEGSDPEGTLQPDDPLRRYYLNLDNLTETGVEDVRRMLEDFWKRYTARDRIGGALNLLGLTTEAGPDEIKKAHRRLVREHHPDLGGDGERIREINEAMELLRRHFQF